MKKNRSLSLLHLLAGLVLSFSATGYSSILLFPPDAWPNSDWSVRIYNNPLVQSATLQGEDWLSIGRTVDNNGSAQVIYNAGHVNESGNPVFNLENQLADIRGSVIVGSSNWGDSLGILMRASGSAFNNAGVSNAYYLALTSNGLGLYWNVGDRFFGDPLVSTLAFNTYSQSLGTLSVSNNNQYLLEFSAVGMQFDATLWTLDANGEKLGDALASISYLDERPEARESGYFGLRGGRYGGVRTAYFRELNVQIVPEPSLTSLLLFGLGIGLAKKWHSKKHE